MCMCVMCPVFVQDSSHEAVAGFDEYLVPPALLDRLAGMAGLEKLCSENFQSFFKRMSQNPSHAALLKRTNVLDWKGSLTLQEWETIGTDVTPSTSRRASALGVLLAWGRTHPSFVSCFPLSAINRSSSVSCLPVLVSFWLHSTLTHTED